MKNGAAIDCAYLDGTYFYNSEIFLKKTNSAIAPSQIRNWTL